MSEAQCFLGNAHEIKKFLESITEDDVENLCEHLEDNKLYWLFYQPLDYNQVWVSEPFNSEQEANEWLAKNISN